jgi:hypothetical protein
MTDKRDPYVQMGTRIPQWLHHNVRLHCVRTSTRIHQFLAAALIEALPPSLRQPLPGGLLEGAPEHPVEAVAGDVVSG